MATQVARQMHRTEQTPRMRWWERLPGQGQWTPYLFVLPTLILILVIAIYPMLDSIHISLLNNPLLTNPRFVGLRNYGQILIDPVFQLAFKATLIFAICSVVLETIFGLGIALLVNQTFPGRGLVRTVILVPWAFPTVVSAQMWLLMYNDQTGVITYLLQMLHLLGPGTTLLGTSAGVIFASVITDVWKTTPFMALLILAGLQVIPDETYEASDVDGTTRWQRFIYITLPLLKRPLMIALLFRALDAIRVFDLFYVFGLRSVPSLASYANLKMFAGTAYDFAPGVAVAVIVFLIGIVVSLLLVPMMRDNT